MISDFLGVAHHTARRALSAAPTKAEAAMQVRRVKESIVPTYNPAVGAFRAFTGLSAPRREVSLPPQGDFSLSKNVFPALWELKIGSDRRPQSRAHPACALCRETLGNASRGTALCGHQFHQECLEALEQIPGSTCGVCHSALSVSDPATFDRELGEERLKIKSSQPREPGERIMRES